jgi:hypothetical protein
MWCVWGGGVNPPFTAVRKSYRKQGDLGHWGGRGGGHGLTRVEVKAVQTKGKRATDTKFERLHHLLLQLMYKNKSNGRYIHEYAYCWNPDSDPDSIRNWILAFILYVRYSLIVVVKKKYKYSTYQRKYM